MRLFADLEFTAFRDPRMRRLGFPYSPDAKMLSAGLVTEDGQELYIEVNNPEDIDAASEFVHTHVLPQFGLHPATRVHSSREAGNALADFLTTLSGDLVICADYTDDLRFLIEALQEAGRFSEFRERLQFEQVYAMVCAPGAAPLWDVAFERLEEASGLVRHHALLDARALKAVYMDLARGATSVARSEYSLHTGDNGRVAGTAWTNDNLDRGYPSEEDNWDVSYSSRDEALARTGGTHIGADTSQVNVFLDGRLVDRAGTPLQGAEPRRRPKP